MVTLGRRDLVWRGARVPAKAIDVMAASAIALANILQAVLGITDI